ncbi:hypothetical protein M3876_06680 [Rothia kristinae]|uniref:Uncharacterized protein n=2 Tax=Micrococcaceae TaxID=1268 RepID=A0A147E7B8_9MICC|nr:hypothetical protein [Rothia kristinae]MDN5640089.1 hypothetical protein [Actinomycetes bacterium]KTR37751.1 hypothetical protein RSA5_06685 [Rothia kristinae]KTR60154.1 hypothetical protein SA11R_01820 [Rothia kristinae]KTR74515.1 hypothetical protein SA15R_00065 [Rothia kristinae]KTR78905.1 hypothetical protein SA14R_04635 [Rothia kristinae]
MMRTLRTLTLTLLAAVHALSLRLRPQPGESRDRGDVPGWVMITMMSALLVAALLAIAIPALTGMFNNAMSKVG